MAESRVELDRALARTAEQPDAGGVEALVRRIYAEHGHNDDWGVRVIYEGQMIQHLSDALAGVIREAQAAAWDEGYDRRGDAARAFGREAPEHLTPPNPYRAARIDGGER